MLEIIKEAVTTITGLDLDKVTRQRDHVQARAMYYYFARHSGATLDSIGKSAGKDHTTIMYALKKFDEYHTYDNIFRKQYAQLSELLSGIKDDTKIDVTDSLRLKNESLIQNNIKLQRELSKASQDKPKVIEDLLEGIPKERIEFFINNQLATFVKMERATLKKLEQYEEANKQIRADKQSYQQEYLEEEGGRARNTSRQSTYLSSQYRS